MSGLLYDGDFGDETRPIEGVWDKRQINVLWVDMKFHCFECGKRFQQRVNMEEPAVDCPECGSEVAIALPHEPRMRKRKKPE